MGWKKKSSSIYHKYTYVIHIFIFYISVYGNKTNILSTRRHTVSGLQETMIQGIYTFMYINISFWIVFRFQLLAVAVHVPTVSACNVRALNSYTLQRHSLQEGHRCDRHLNGHFFKLNKIHNVYKERKWTWLQTGNVYLICLFTSQQVYLTDSYIRRDQVHLRCRLYAYKRLTPITTYTRLVYRYIDNRISVTRRLNISAK